MATLVDFDFNHSASNTSLGTTNPVTVQAGDHIYVLGKHAHPGSTDSADAFASSTEATKGGVSA
jgi:hypothetical protein